MQKISEIMTPSPATLTAERPVIDAARTMADQGIGDVLVVRDGRLVGLVTDRDLAVRVLAEGRDPATTPVGDVCSGDPATLGPDDDVSAAIALVRERAVRRIPVVDGGTAVGIVSIGDLAIERDETSALADLSAAPDNT